jgi:uncharacterized protein
MGDRYLEIATTDTVRHLQERLGSRSVYARQETGPLTHHELGPEEIAFIQTQDTFFLASVGEDGWPYVQHRGGPPGFLQVLDSHTLAFPDFRGNRQYISFGNILKNPKVSLFLIDFAARERLKIFGHATLVEENALPDSLSNPNLKATPGPIERGIVVKVEAFHWNCPKYIVPRFSADQVGHVIEPLQRRIEELEAVVEEFRNAGVTGVRK